MRPLGKGKYQSMDNTKIEIKIDNFTERVKRSPDERHIKEHIEALLIRRG